MDILKKKAKKAKQKRKAVLFSVLAMLIASLLFVVLLPSTDKQLTLKTEIAKTRIKAVNGLVSSTDGYFQSALDVASLNAMDSLTERILKKGYTNYSELQCNFEKLCADGRIVDYEELINLGFDLKFNIGDGIVKTFETDNLDIGYLFFYQEYGFFQKFRSENKTFLKTGQILLGDTTQAEYYINIYVLNDVCGKPGRILDHANFTANFTTPGLEIIIYNFSFKKQYPVDRNETLYFFVIASSLAPPSFPGPPFTLSLFVDFVDSARFPDGNATSFYNFNAGQNEYPLMKQGNIDYFSQKLANYSLQNFGIEPNYKVRQITLSQSEPWNFDVSMNMTIYIQDNHFAAWEKNSLIKTKIPIEGLLDPLFAKGTNGTINRTFKRDKSIMGVWDLKINETRGNITLFSEYYQKGNYVMSSRAPSFLMRYINSSNPSPIGIETLVNKSFPDLNTSYMDFYYFTNKTFNCGAGELMKVSSDPSNIFGHFKIDKFSVAYYGFGSMNDSNFTEIIC